MTEQPREARDPFAPPDGSSAQPPGAPYAPPSFPPPTGDPLPPPTWTGVAAQPYGAPAPAPRRRRGWLIAGAVVGGLVVVAATGVAAVSVLGEALARMPAGGKVSISAVPVGRCYVLDESDRRAGVAGRVSLVDCSTAHDGQVYALVPLSFEDWPGQEAISAAGESGCTAMERVLDDSLYESTGLQSSWYVPSQKNWSNQRHVVQCVVQSEQALGLTRDWMTSGG